MKNFIQWNYARGSWQYDVFCLLIVAFIFLTPKAWFEKRERLATRTARPVVKAQDFPPENADRQKRVGELSGNARAEIARLRETRDERGEKFYEIEIK